MKDVLQLLDDMASEQQAKLARLARHHKEFITSDDLLQPADFPELEQDPEFRYEEGIWAGILSAKAAISAAQFSSES